MSPEMTDSVKTKGLMPRLEAAWFAFRPWAPWVSLAFGLWNAFGVVRHYEQARWVAWMLAGAWLVFAALAWIRWRAQARGGAGRRTEIVIYLFSWASQSLSQEILFFVLPFWIRSTTWSSHNAPFTVLLLLLAASTLYDPLYMERIAGRTRLLLVHKALVAFAGLAFVVPVLMGAHTLRALALAGGLAGLATAFAVRTRRTIAVPVLGACAGAVLAVGMSDWIAPVPLRIEHGVFSRGVRGKCPVDTLRSAQPGSELWAWTPVFAPSGLTDTVFHVWSRDGRELARIPLPLHGGRKEGFRIWSSSRRAAASAGDVELEVVTAGGQLVGAMTISVR
jgi:hypothetical protein